MPDIVAGLCSKQNKRKHFFGKAVTLGGFFLVLFCSFLNLFVCFGIIGFSLFFKKQ